MSVLSSRLRLMSARLIALTAALMFTATPAFAAEGEGGPVNLLAPNPGLMV